MKKAKNQSNNFPLVAIPILVGLFLVNWVIRYPQIALTLAQQPQLILPYLVEQVGWFWLIIGMLGFGVRLSQVVTNPTRLQNAA